MAREYPPDHPPQLVERIMEIILTSGFCSVHYTGGADEGLLRALAAKRAELEVSVMDMPDRWGTGYAFWYEEREFGNCLPRERPGWLEGIPFYQEGAPDHEIGLRDWPWDSSDQLERIVSFTGRPPPKLLILFGYADLNTVGIEGIFESGEWERREILRPMPFRHPAYEWDDSDHLWIGRWKAGVTSAYEKEQRYS
jgi:hypothetical protein